VLQLAGLASLLLATLVFGGPAPQAMGLRLPAADATWSPDGTRLAVNVHNGLSHRAIAAGPASTKWVAFIGGRSAAATGVVRDAAGVAYVAGYADRGGGRGTDAFVVAYSPQGGRLWLRWLGGEGHDEATGLTLAGGRVVVAGWSESPTVAGQQGHGRRDVLLAAYNAGGRRRWVRLFGGSAVDTANAIASSAVENLVVAGSTDSADLEGARNAGGLDVLVLRVTPDGQAGPPLVFGGPRDDVAAGVSEFGDALAGTTSSQGLLGQTSGGGDDAFLAALAPDQRAVRWLRLLGGPGDETGRGVATAPGGSVHRPQTDYYLAGSTRPAPGRRGSGDLDLLVARFAGDGALRWQRSGGGPGDETGAALAFWPRCTSRGCPAAVGVIGATSSRRFAGAAGAGSWDALVVTYSPAGRLLRARLAGSPAADVAYAGYTALEPGRVYLAGTTCGRSFLGRPVPGACAAFVALTGTGVRAQ
jgi:hypothetical protein